MKGKFCYFMSLVMVLHMVSWVCVTSRNFIPHEGLSAQLGTSQNPHSFQITSQSSKKVKNSLGREIMTNKKEVSKIGSSPPNCEHKCLGCLPCEAIQVPTTASRAGAGVHVQYTNYEPEGWKCKCGPTFYSP